MGPVASLARRKRAAPRKALARMAWSSFGRSREALARKLSGCSERFLAALPTLQKISQLKECSNCATSWPVKGESRLKERSAGLDAASGEGTIQNRGFGGSSPSSPANKLHCQKAKTAFYEKGVPFETKLLDGSEPVASEFAAPWPISKFPVAVDGPRLIFEATSIDRRVKNIIPPRPLTHDLIVAVVEQLGGDLQDIVISDLQDHTYFAKLRVRKEGELIEIDCRPSDAIAVAVTAKVPIWVAEDVLAETAADEE